MILFFLKIWLLFFFKLKDNYVISHFPSFHPFNHYAPTLLPFEIKVSIIKKSHLKDWTSMAL